ncbi:hypothetical protein BRADI_2g59001v3 [Brachypodium distachyon]|uniref:Nucleotide-diphospho-sugar transferase domain-containing protein n=1 Tax=Brachypodium distachyon TaxID=15368 RepID=A0A0Q3KJD3_BRADI|nr:hypothetical protein BRADI_2g59001v3 [Brachypodium distachyon]
MGLVKEGSLKPNHHNAVWFLLGAALPTILLFFLASDRVGDRLPGVSIWGKSSNGSLPLPPEAAHHAQEQQEQEQEDKFPGLAQLLPRVAMEDRTVIITSVNEAWARPGSLLDIYRESFKNGEDTEHLLNHVLIVALDPTGFGRCNVVHPYCYLLEDTDMIMMRNPLRHIPVYADMSVSTDNFLDARVPLTNPLNTGLYYMKATNRSISMLRYWQEARPRFPRLNDQPVFARIKHELVEKLQVRIEPLRTIYFGGFCQYHDDFDKISIMHADCCIGVDNKVHDLMDVAADWKRYRSLTRKKKRNMNVKLTWTVPVRCRKSIHRRKPVRRH